MSAQQRERTVVLDERGDLDAEPGSRPWAVAVRAKLLEHLHDNQFSAQALQRWRDAMVLHQGFRTLEDGAGRPFRTYKAFCLARPPFGLGYDPVLIDRILAERVTAQERAQAPVLLRDVGRPTRGEQEPNVVNHNIRASDLPQADYLTARIKRDRPDVLARMQAGEFVSVRAAALEAGIAKRRLNIPADVSGAARALQRHFTRDEIGALVALLETPAEENA